MDKDKDSTQVNVSCLARLLPHDSCFGGVWKITESHGKITCKNHYEVIDERGEFVGNAYFSLTFTKSGDGNYEIRFDRKSSQLALRYNIRDRVLHAFKGSSN